ncbi:MAG TPA: MFS transporter, partial [Aestuariivirga sp.]|nr:MFS transporter [Aestuariivirga sp.]
LLAGLGLLVAADLVLGVVPGTGALFAGVALWGLHMGLTQGILTALVADHVPAHLRGTGFGLFNLVSGVALLIASLGAGMIWDRFGPGATFLTGAGLAAVALIVSGGVAAGEKNHAAQRDKP